MYLLSRQSRAVHHVFKRSYNSNFSDVWKSTHQYRQDFTTLKNKHKGNQEEQGSGWITPPAIVEHLEREQQQEQGIPGANQPKPQYKKNERSSGPSTTNQKQTTTSWSGNANITITKNKTSNNAGKKDEYFKLDNNNYQQKYTEFIIEHGFAEEYDINEQFEWLNKSYKLQYDPDDPDGNRLPPNHAGRNLNKKYYNNKERYYGKSFNKEKLEFNHFNKSFILDSTPPFPDRMVHHEPTDNNETGLYLPHITQNIPQWTLKKKIAKTYGPNYIHNITLPPIGLPDKQDFNAMLKQFVNEKKWKKYGIDVMNKQNNDNISETLHTYLNDSEPNKYIDQIIFPEINQNRIKDLGVGTPFHDKNKDIISRDYEIWDVDLCYELKEDGDPSIPMDVKNEIFQQYVKSIDRNGSMAPWQKNYAFSLLPKAFGGPKGEYIDTILSKMKPKEEKIQYELKRQEQDIRTRKKQKTRFKNRLGASAAGLGL